jgi:hypothetical protein
MYMLLHILIMLVLEKGPTRIVTLLSDIFHHYPAPSFSFPFEQKSRIDQYNIL